MSGDIIIRGADGKPTEVKKIGCDSVISSEQADRFKRLVIACAIRRAKKQK